jgi:hypothetical protein
MNAEDNAAILKMEIEKRDALLLEIEASKARQEVYSRTALSIAGGSPAWKKVDEKIQKEISLQRRLSEDLNTTDARISAYEELAKILSKGNSTFKLREGTDLAKAEQFIRSCKGEVVIERIWEYLGYEMNPKKKKSVRASLKSYARDRKVFKLGAQPESFSLIEFEQKPQSLIVDDFGGVAKK